MNTARNHSRRALLPRLFIIWAGLAILMFSGSRHASAAPESALTPFANIYVQGDVVSAGVGLRGTGMGDITLTGIPAGADVFRAYLYWATLGSSSTYQSVTLDGFAVTGQLIDTAADTCWGVQNNFVYRADVSTIIPGNGTFTIAGLPASLADGNDSQGASLVVVYSDTNASYRNVVINDGAVALNLATDVYTSTISGYTLDAGPVDAEITYLVGDGQADYVSGDVTFEDAVVASDVFNGSDGAYWDTLAFDVSDWIVPPPVQTAVSNLVPGDPDSPDCLLWAGTVMSVSAPPPGASVNDLSLAESLLIHGDVTAAGIGLRGTGEGDITLTGIPTGSVVNRAYLYWATLGSSYQYETVMLDGFSVEGDHIATSGDTCWGVPNNFVYRADVTDLVDENGTYTISGLPDSLALDGNDSQGASLVVVYSGPPESHLLRRVIIRNGAVTLDLDTNSYTDTISGYQPDSPVTEAHITYIVGDGQSEWDNGDVVFNGTSIASNVFNGSDGDYWGTLTFDVTTLVGPEPSTTTINNEAPGGDSPDCLLWLADVFSVTAPQPVYTQWIYLPVLLR